MVLQKGAGFYKVNHHESLRMCQHFICYHSHRKKREAKIKRDVKLGIRELNEQNPFEIFVTVTDIRYTYVSNLLVNFLLLIIRAGIIRSRKRFWATPTACAYYKTLRLLRPTPSREQSRRWRVVDWLYCY
jgi:hypothetical protein